MLPDQEDPCDHPQGEVLSLNAPDGAGCSLTPRRVERQLTCTNATPDRQWPNREQSGQRAQAQFRGLFVGNTRVATDARNTVPSAAFQPLPNEKPTPTPTELLRTSPYYLPCNFVSFLRARLLADTPSASARSARTAHNGGIMPLCAAACCVNTAVVCGKRSTRGARIEPGRPPGNDLAEPVTQPRIHVPARRATALRH